MDIDRLFTTRPDITTILAIENRLPAFREIYLFPGSRIFDFCPIGRRHNERRRHRVDGIETGPIGGITRKAIRRGRHALVQADPGSEVARSAQPAVHERQGVERLSEHFASRNLCSGLTSEEIDLLGISNLFGEATDGSGGNTADCLGPFRSLRFSIVGAQYVILEIVFLRRAFRHMFGIESDAVFVEKFLIVQIAFNLVIHHTDAKRRVGTRNNGNPFVGDGRGRLIEPRFDDNHATASFTSILQLIGGIAALVGHPVVAKMEMQLALMNSKRVGSGKHATRHKELGKRPGTERYGAHIMVNGAAQIVEQANHRVKIRIPNVAISGSENRTRSVRVVGLFHFVGNVVKRLVPTDTLPFVLAAHFAVRVIGTPSLTLHRIFNASGRKHVANLSTTTRTGPALGNLDAVLVLLVGANLQRHALFHIDFQEAPRRTATAIVHASACKPRTLFPFGNRLPLF